MTVIEWDRSFEVGVPEMDREHKTLIDMLNKVYDLLRNGEKEKAYRLFMTEFLSYIDSHLSHEEEFLEQIGYPEIERHKKAHDLLRKEIRKLASDMDFSNTKDLAYALSLCWGWIYSHIQKVDKKYGEFFNSKHEG